MATKARERIAAVGFGGNLGQPLEMLTTVADRLRASPGINEVVTSPAYRTAPVGDAAAPAYVNAAFRIETTLAAPELHDCLRTLESSLGRVRTTQWASRTVDLDLLLFGDEVIETPELTVPHPRLHFRRFMLTPLADILADGRHPRLGLTVGELQRRTELAAPAVLVIAEAGQADAVAELVASRPAWRFERASPAQVVDWLELNDRVCGIQTNAAFAEFDWAVVLTQRLPLPAASPPGSEFALLPAFDGRDTASADPVWQSFLQSLEPTERLPQADAVG